MASVLWFEWCHVFGLGKRDFENFTFRLDYPNNVFNSIPFPFILKCLKLSFVRDFALLIFFGVFLLSKNIERH